MYPSADENISRFIWVVFVSGDEVQMPIRPQKHHKWSPNLSITPPSKEISWPSLPTPQSSSKSPPPSLPFPLQYHTGKTHEELAYGALRTEKSPGRDMSDTVDKLVVFLAKRDGIDKLVKTFQYVSKLVHWHVESTHPDIARRAKNWEVASGLSRKAFRTGRFLTGFNALRRGPGASPTMRALAVLANSGEMVYFFFDHLLWLSRIGTLDGSLARRMSFVSAFGESFGYIFFIVADIILLREGAREERRLVESKEEESIKDWKERVAKIRGERIMRLMGVAANLADLVIAIADIEPNPFCNHTVTLGISGLVSAWSGWYRNWPSS